MTIPAHLREIAEADEHPLYRLQAAFEAEGLQPTVAQAVALQLLGGVQSEAPSGGVKRGRINLLLVHDADFDSASAFERIADYSSGGEWIHSGAITRSDLITRWSREANRIEPGLAFDSEVDAAYVTGARRLDADSKNDLTAVLVSQEYTVAKAGETATFEPHAAFTLIDTPKGGRIDDRTPIADQLPVNPSLAARCDLVLVNDEVNTAEPSAEPLDAETMVEYLWAARSIYPELDDEAKDCIIDFVEGLYSPDDLTSGEPLRTIIGAGTARLATILWRLTEATARSRLSETATEKDASKAIELLIAAWEDLGADWDVGDLDVDMIATGSDSSQNYSSPIEDAIIDLQDERDYEEGVPQGDIATRMDADEGEVEQKLEKLKREGKVYEPRDGGWKVL